MIVLLSYQNQILQKSKSFDTNELGGLSQNNRTNSSGNLGPQGHITKNSLVFVLSE